MNTRADRLTALIDSDFPYRKAPAASNRHGLDNNPFRLKNFCHTRKNTCDLSRCDTGTEVTTHESWFRLNPVASARHSTVVVCPQEQDELDALVTFKCE